MNIGYTNTLQGDDFYSVSLMNVLCFDNLIFLADFSILYNYKINVHRQLL